MSKTATALIALFALILITLAYASVRISDTHAGHTSNWEKAGTHHDHA